MDYHVEIQLLVQYNTEMYNKLPNAYWECIFYFSTCLMWLMTSQTFNVTKDTDIIKGIIVENNFDDEINTNVRIETDVTKDKDADDTNYTDVVKT